MALHIDILPLLTTRLEQVGEVLGVQTATRLIELEPKRDVVRGDAVFDIQLGDETKRFLVEAKAVVDRYVVIGQVKGVAEQVGLPALLLAPYVTTAMAKRCRELDIAFLDAAGNAHLKIGPTFVFMVGNKPKGLQTIRDDADRRPVEWKAPGPYETGRVTPTALRVIFALLCKPRLINAPYREIREAADVALGAIGGVFFDLEGRHFAVGKQPKRRLVDLPRLVDEWTTTFPLTLRRKLNPQRFRAANHDWWKQEVLEPGAYWGGEVAADELTRYLKPAAQTIYVNPQKRPAVIAKLAAKHKLRADPWGNIEILDTFWTFDVEPPEKRIVPPLLVYADLVATADPRNLEVARQVRERYIDNTFDLG